MEIIIPLAAILAPILGTVIIGLSGSRVEEHSARIGIVALACSALASAATLVMVLKGMDFHLTIPAGQWKVLTYSFLIDRLAAVMMVLISFVSLVIHVYSKRYMVDEKGYVRFFVLLGVLTFVLLNLVTSGSLMWIFVCWHLITWLLASLLSFNEASHPARAAGQRTLWVQGIGDAAFAAAAAILYLSYGTFDLGEIFERLQEPPVFLTTGSGIEVPGFTTLILLIAVMTKSAQFPFHIWLPGTIEAPTPVSALLHAGIVNAGGFLVNRLAPLYGASSFTLHLMFLIGALTALIGAATMLTQSSIKRTLVYSTMGQMGYMVMECGLGAFALAVFHLFAHGMFKATLFLNSGENIHKARTEFKLPSRHDPRDAPIFSFLPWATGLAITLVLPLFIVLMAHGLLRIPLFETQGALIFLFFAWVTSSQVILSLYRLNVGASWKVSFTMIAALTFIGITYLWAGESFTHFLYPEPGQATAYFQAAAWNQGLFDSFIAVAALIITGVWVILYSKSHGYALVLPRWMVQVHHRLYVAFLNAVYIEDLLCLLRPALRRVRLSDERSRPW